MPFNPETEYTIVRQSISVRHFHAYKRRYVIRPPYQRKTVWETQKKRALLDSLFRRYYIPSIVLREVRLSPEDTRREVIDGQQRISTVQQFFNNELALPDSLEDINAGLPGKRYNELHDDIREFIDEELKYDAEIIKNIGDPYDDRHQKVAADIFWRLQQGESLNVMETAHSRLSSLVRNFLVRYADDYDFDYVTYSEINPNPDKIPFFRETRSRSNSRMQHLSLLGRFLLLELADGPTRIGDREIAALIESTDHPDGIGNQSWESEPAAIATLRNLQKLHEVFKDDPHLDSWSGVMAFRHEYFTISCYWLLRHLRRYYVFNEDERLLFREFVYDFFGRVSGKDGVSDTVVQFVENRQQDPTATAERERIIRHEFFTFASQKGHDILAKDSRRAFNEAERIAIYRKGRGRCQLCVQADKPDRETIVPWNEFEADHVLPHSQGGQTLIENGQVLCREHNRRKGATV